MPLPPKPPPPPPAAAVATRQTPHERAQAKPAARRGERQQRERCAKQELGRLHAERRSTTDSLGSASASLKELLASLGSIETENERWQTPNGNLGEMYRLKDEIERAEKRVKECHRRWDELGLEIEEKHLEIAFGGSGDD